MSMDVGSLVKVLGMIGLISGVLTWLQYQAIFREPQKVELSPIKMLPTKGQKLGKHSENLRIIQAMMDEDPMLESTLRALFEHRHRKSTTLHIVETLAINVSSVLSGWLLSAFIDPKTLLPFLTHL
jgi:hypothetical protein